MIKQIKEYESKVDLMIRLYSEGKLGTPDNPDRRNSLHAAFWSGYFGHRHPWEFPKYSTSKACVAAGRMVSI